MHAPSVHGAIQESHEDGAEDRDLDSIPQNSGSHGPSAARETAMARRIAWLKARRDQSGIIGSGSTHPDAVKNDILLTYIRKVYCFRTAEIPVFHPLSFFRLRWDVLVTVLLLYCLVEIPYRICFELYVAPTHPYEIVNLLVDLFLLADVFIQLRTGFFEQSGVLNTNPSVIAKRYARGWMGIDIFTSIPWMHLADLEGSDGALLTRAPRLIRILKVFRLLKLLRLFKLMKIIDHWEEKVDTWRIVLKAGKFILMIFFLAHFAGCGLMGSTIITRRGSSDGFCDMYDDESWIVSYFGESPHRRDESNGIEAFTCSVSRFHLYLVDRPPSLQTVLTRSIHLDHHHIPAGDALLGVDDPDHCRIWRHHRPSSG